MTQSPSFAQKFFAAIMAFTATVILASAPAAAAKGPYYVAKLATPIEEAKTEIIRGVVWQCAGDTCRARKASSRASNVCARLVKKMGAVETFMVRGEALAADDLSNCNAKA
jgi:hypothetical protein